MGSEGHSSGNVLTEKTAVLGLRAYVLVVIAVVALLTGGLAALLLFIRSRSRGNRLTRWKLSSGLIPTFMMDIDDTALERGGHKGGKKFEGEKKMGAEVVEVMRVEEGGKGAGESSGSKAGTEIMGNIGWGRWYTMEELDTATGRFAQWNVIGEGGYGVVYRGVLPDLTVVAIKNLLNKKGQAEKEFKVEVEVIGRVRHKNLVGLLGYCAEGPKRLLVYEYMDNGNLEQWLHGEIGPVNQLTWEIRMKIAIGTAKGLAHLHEGLEPKVVHRDIKSSNILLDKYWNPKVSDFGLAKLLGAGSNYVSTRVMGTFGYVAPEYASTGMLNESSDIYSFGVLLMEIITGRSPVDYRRPTGEVNLVEWFRGMVGSKHVDDVLDPSIEVQPSPRALKKALLVCLRCVDLDAQKRPRMGQVAHMLEGDEFPFRQEHRPSREVPQLTGVPASDTPTATVRLPLITDKLGFNPLERSLWR